MARVSGGDGGYDDTAIMVSEAALLLARERAALPLSNLRGGFYTPAIAFGGRLVDVLNTQGVLFQFLGFGESAIPRDAGTLAGRIAPPSTIGAPPTVR
ncbi:hypothetical protein EON68_02105 [archaeon]|nr:MAG: hypothetical protein EON68_02105 [archaeon]